LILEFGLDQYLGAQRAQLKQEQLAALREVIDAAMVAPVRALYKGEVDSETLTQARRDVGALRAALLAAEHPTVAEPRP
jgi:hypothetical protein